MRKVPVVWQRTAKKFTKCYNPRAQPLFCSLNLLFSDVPVAVAVVVILNSLVRELKQPRRRQGGRRPEVRWKAVRKRDLRISSSIRRLRRPPLVDDVKRSSFTSSWTYLNLKSYNCLKGTNLLSFVIAFNWLEILFFTVVVLKSSVRFVDYKID